MRKIEEAIKAVVEAVMRPATDVQEAVSGAIAENIATFALDNSVPGPGQGCNSIDILLMSQNLSQVIF